MTSDDAAPERGSTEEERREGRPYRSRNWEVVRAEMIARGQVSEEGIARARQQLQEFLERGDDQPED